MVRGLSAVAEYWEQQASKFMRREWGTVCNNWIRVAPDSLLNGEGPQGSIGQLPSVKAIASSVDSKHGLRLSDDDAPAGLREGILLEAIFLVHKAAHVFGAAQVHSRQGLLSWSLADGYQSAAFAMRSILSFLGLGIVEIDRGTPTFVVDAWAPPVKKTRKHHEVQPDLTIRCAHRPDHKALWTMFLRLIRIVDVDEGTWPSAYTSKLQSFGAKDFSRQRNKLHYWNDHWPLGDLHFCGTPDSLCNPSAHFEGGALKLDPSETDFSVALAGTLLFLAVRLMRDLSAKSNVIGAELSLIRGWFSSDFLELWQSVLLVD